MILAVVSAIHRTASCHGGPRCVLQVQVLPPLQRPPPPPPWPPPPAPPPAPPPTVRASQASKSSVSPICWSVQFGSSLLSSSCLAFPCRPPRLAFADAAVEPVAGGAGSVPGSLLQNTVGHHLVEALRRRAGDNKGHGEATDCAQQLQATARGRRASLVYPRAAAIHICAPRCDIHVVVHGLIIPGDKAPLF